MARVRVRETAKNAELIIGKSIDKGDCVIIINDIVWLDKIIQKLAWKHNVLPSEVEEVLTGNCRIFKK